MVRASLGRKISLVEDVRKSSSLVVEHSKTNKSAYPCYALPIKTLLELETWQPHQDLLKQGLLCNVDELDGEANVIFLSHQWTSFMHPDPKNAQLHALQTLLKNLLSGSMSVRSNPNLEMAYNYHRIVGPEEWRTILENGYIWDKLELTGTFANPVMKWTHAPVLPSGK